MSYLFCLFGFIFSFPSSTADYSFEEKVKTFAETQMLRPEAGKLFSCTSRQWEDLNGDLLVQKLNRLGDKKATILAATCFEFKKLLEPNANMQTLKNRQGIFECLMQVQDQLDPLLSELAEQEHVFTYLLQQEKKPSASYGFYLFTLQGGTFFVLTGLNLPFVFRHFFNDWRTMRANHRNIIWYYVILSLKVGGLLGGLYGSYQSACFMIGNIKNEFKINDRLVLDLAKAMKPLRKIMALIAEHPTLANNFANFIDFDHELLLNTKLAQTLASVDKRLAVEGTFFARLWAAKDSPALYEQIKGFTNYFKLIYWSCARLDAYGTVVRIYDDAKKKAHAVCWVQFMDTSQRPYFSFEQLRNPLIEDSVSNDFKLDGHAVLNGTCTSGKSGAGKAITWAFGMGQSILLVFATKAEMAPVSAIGTYANVGDDIEKNQSGFKKQYREMERLIKLAKEKSGRTLLFLDEPIKGIQHDVGEVVIADLVKQLIALPRLTFLLSTHYESPTSFADTENAVQNWQPEIREIDGKFERTFVIMPGKSWWYTDREKALRFIKQICDEEDCS